MCRDAIAFAGDGSGCFLDGFREAITAAIEFVEQHGPQDMVQVFIDEEQMLGHSFQLYANSAAILRHWELSDP